MTNENDLIQKLMISKKIMDRHNEIPRSGASGSQNMNENYSYETPQSPQTPDVFYSDAPPSKFNIPEEYLPQTQTVSSPPKPLVVTEEKIKNSKLPDAIKKLMIENPIQQPNTMAGPTLSDDLIERASRLMNENKSQQNFSQSKQTKPQQMMNGDLKKMMKEVLEEILKENGLITESETKSQDTFQFKVGKHIFEGKITKVKKLQ